MNTFNLIAAVGGEGIVRSLMIVLVIGICVLAIWAVGKYFIKVLEAPPKANNIWNAIFVILGLFVLVNFLLGLIGFPLLKW